MNKLFRKKRYEYYTQNIIALQDLDPTICNLDPTIYNLIRDNIRILYCHNNELIFYLFDVALQKIRIFYVLALKKCMNLLIRFIILPLRMSH